jgi:hypothetical protein
MLVICAVAAGLTIAGSPVFAATIYVSAGGSLQAALNAAQPGDVVVLQAGATFSGNFTLPVKSGSAWITVRTSTADHLLPAPGVRITPSFAPLLAAIRSPNTAPALSTAAGSHHWRLMLLEFGPNALGAGEILQIGSGSSSQFDLSQVPYEIEIDRVYVHGDPVAGQKRGIALNGRSVAIRNSYIADIKAVAQDSQAIAGWNGPGPYTIENNYLEAAGENVLFGGADPAIPFLVAEDVTVRYNHVAKPPAWRGTSWQVKNLFELKNARRVLVESNVFENNWDESQPGYAILFTPRNQGGGCTWCVVEQVTFQYNIVRHAGGGINLSGYDDLNPSGQTAGITIRHNLFYGLADAVGSGWFLLIGSQPRDIVVDHNTIDHDGTAVLYAHGGTAAAPERILGFAFTNNAARHNSYGINGASGAAGNLTISMYFPDGDVRGNWLAGGSAAAYPAGNFFAGPYDPAFANVAATDYRPAAGSVLLSAATDGGNIGADIAALRAGLAGVVDGSPAWTGLSPVWSASAPAPSSSCTTPRPAANWVCVDGGWVPPDHPLASGTGSSAPSPGAAPPAPAPLPAPSTCTTPLPVAGWVCVSGGWVPPDHPLALNAAAGTSATPAPAPTAPAAPIGPSTCTTPQPGANWVCVNGGWLPPDHPLARQGS